jgi:hypothetical protein
MPEDELQVLDVVGCDLLERAVVGCVIVATDHEPIAIILLAHHRVRYRHVVRNFTRDGESGWSLLLSATCAATTASGAGSRLVSVRVSWRRRYLAGGRLSLSPLRRRHHARKKEAE